MDDANTGCAAFIDHSKTCTHNRLGSHDAMESGETFQHLSERSETDVQSAASGHIVKKSQKNETEQMVSELKTEELTSKGIIEEHSCWITGIELIDDNRLAIADQNNKLVKVISLNQKTITNYIQLSYKPWDITTIQPDTLAVTCPSGGSIQLVSVSQSGSLSLGRQIHMSLQGEPCGIQYSDTGGGVMYVSFVYPGKVRVLDMTGTILKDLSFDSSGRSMFSFPYYIALSSDGQRVFVTDYGNSSVTSKTLDGRVMYTYLNDQLKRPTGLAVGDNGVIYVCGYGPHNIHMVSKEGKKINVLMGEDCGVRYPYGIRYNSTAHKLYVGMWKATVFEY